jgi:hypothetical protein
MKRIATNRQSAKTGARMSAGRRAVPTRPLEGKIKGREVRPGWGTVGDIVSARISSGDPRCARTLNDVCTQQFFNSFNKNRASRAAGDE